VRCHPQPALLHAQKWLAPLPPSLFYTRSPNRWVK
jgi:hypothetical protein